MITNLLVNEEPFLGKSSGIGSNCANRLDWEEK